MEPEGSSPHSQAPATCPYHEPAQSSPHTLIPPQEISWPNSLSFFNLELNVISYQITFLTEADFVINICYMYTVSGNGNPSTELDHVITQMAIVKNIFFLPWRNSPSGPRPPQCRGLMITLYDKPHSVGLLRTSDQPDAKTVKNKYCAKFLKTNYQK